MGFSRPARPVKLIAALLGEDVDLIRRARYMLSKRYGPVDLESSIEPFRETQYYAAEMGTDLKRCYMSFENLVRPERLADIKRDTNAMEEQMKADTLSSAVLRPVNIDPGYVDLGKLVLATTKDQPFHVYIGSGIYAQLTLHYRAGGWQTWPWTYPDYAKDETRGFFGRVRDVFLEQRRRTMDILDAADGAQMPASIAERLRGRAHGAFDGSEPA
jgi:hypothetical protein